MLLHDESGGTIITVMRQKSIQVRLNQQIRVSRVRLIDADGSQAGIVSREEALRRAEEAELDLVEISPNAEPPVCRIMDYGKYLFEQTKKHKKQKQIHVKEVKFRPVTEEGDYQVKVRNIKRFLANGDKAKVTLRFKGREIAHQEIGLELLKRVLADLELEAVIEQPPKPEGRQQMIMILAPKRRK